LIGKTGCGLAFKEGESGFDVNIGRVQVGGSAIGIQGITRLVVARFILGRLAWVEDEVGDNLTRVPRSYQTSEMLGFSLMARE
jgi:hypothetical protein